eukprot:c15557_g1_i2.p1 GENE.c15557_g1_i2~~c15557_g1_i2.p1  ORF type:complete len:205 (+),score=33.26 c15557_g1_i2:167-781(+)
MLCLPHGVADAGHLAPIYIFSIYVLSTILVLPLFGFHGVSGYVYGTLKGALLVSFSQTVGAACAFLIARHIVRPWVKSFLQARYGDRFRAIDAAVAKGSEGFKIVTLMRLSPIVPYSVTNYVCGCTQMSLVQFVAGTWLGVLPGTTAYVNFGAVGKTLKDGNVSNVQMVLYAVGILATLLVTREISKVATKALREAGLAGAKDE